MEKKKVIIDIGNSRLKILINELYYSFFHKDNSILQTKELFAHNKHEIDLIGISSVNKTIEKELIDLLNLFNFNYKTSEELIKSQNLIDYSNVTGMGHDRIFGLIAATDYYNPPLITIDCGTAITINVLDEKQKVIGGVIFPGPYTQLKALAENAEALFETKLFAGQSIIANSTFEAINNGILYSIAGGIVKIISLINKDCYNFKKNIIMTGGAAELLIPVLTKFNFNPMFVQDLVLNGIMKCLINNEFKENINL